jgi:hypothetical protein
MDENIKTEAIDSSASTPSTQSTEPKRTDEVGGDDLTKLMKALEAERENRKRLEKETKEKAQKINEYESSLERFRAIDPERYEKLIRAEQEREEQELIRKQNYEEAKTRYLQESEASKKKAENWQRKYEQTVVETAIKTAFYDQGGRKSGYDLESQGIDDVAPVDAIMTLLSPRIKLEEGRVVITSRTGEVETNSEGRPKTLGEKMLELRKGSMGALFEPESRSSGSGMTPTFSSGGQNYKLFSREQARNGKASIDDIAAGRAVIH